MGGVLVVREARRSEHAVAWEPVTPDQWDVFDTAQRRRAAQLTPEHVAACYREALGNPDPKQGRRLTAAVADRLIASRGHMSR